MAPTSITATGLDLSEGTACPHLRSLSGTELRTFTLTRQPCVVHICVTHMDRPRRDRDVQPVRRVEFHILLSLAAGDRHGYGVLKDIEARGETGVPDVGTMYRALARLADLGYIEAAS